ncbi:larval cuticle protein A2B-like [Episyrphus balteatus]|uniref:larval cuticle protein A2B-like n=1 Tax=Episyrphus balteatus TaxID=286459 RepID=UPI002484EB31|nr:larval cuticle protein A2B-like [Episyrphus balteatus]
MAFKFVVLLACVMAANAGLLAGGILQPTVLTKRIEVEAPPKYTFSYSVNDPTTGDSKSQEETRDGDIVKGAYSLIDADGLQRIVQYTSDGINGFNAVVSRTPIGKQIVAAQPVIKTLQPTLIKSIPSILSSPLAGIPQLQPLSPLIRPAIASPLGLGIGQPIGSPLGLGLGGHLIG